MKAILITLAILAFATFVWHSQQTNAQAAKQTALLEQSLKFQQQEAEDKASAARSAAFGAKLKAEADYGDAHKAWTEECLRVKKLKLALATTTAGRPDLLIYPSPPTPPPGYPAFDSAAFLTDLDNGGK
jgi:multidrug efflux pump subunit AcrA (membrane-fusion protein)